MEDRLQRIEKEVELLKRREREVYIVSEYDTFRERFDIVGLFDTAEKAYVEAKDLFYDGYLSLEKIENLELGQAYFEECSENIKIQKFLLK